MGGDSGMDSRRRWQHAPSTNKHTLRFTQRSSLASGMHKLPESWQGRTGRWGEEEEKRCTHFFCIFSCLISSICAPAIFSNPTQVCCVRVRSKAVCLDDSFLHNLTSLKLVFSPRFLGATAPKGKPWTGGRRSSAPNSRWLHGKLCVPPKWGCTAPSV